MKTVFLTCLISTLFSSAVLAQYDFAYRLNAEIQTAGAQSLEDLTWQQGITPLMRIDVTRRGQAIAASSDTKVRMIIGPSSTGTYYAQVTNSVATNTYYLLQWPTIGTNSVGTNETADAWWYTIYFEENGHRYWTGNGRLYIEETTSTAEDGLVWQEFIAGYTSSITNYTYHALDPAVEYSDLTGTTITGAMEWTKLDIGEHTQTNADLLFLDLQYSSQTGEPHYAWISGDGTNEQHTFHSSQSIYPFSWRVIVAPLSKSDLYYFRRSTSLWLPASGKITLHGYWQQDVVSSVGGGAGTGSVDIVARGWIAAVSNTADTALSTATGAAATAASAYTAATQAQATADAAATGTPVYAESDPVWANALAAGFTVAGPVSNSAPIYLMDQESIAYYPLTVQDELFTFRGITIFNHVDGGIPSGRITNAVASLNLSTGDFHTAIFSGGTTGTYLSGAGTLQDFPASTGGSTGAVDSVNAATGAITIEGGTDIAVTTTGGVINVAYTGAAGADLSGLSNDVLGAWATASNAFTIAEAASNLAARVAADFDGSSNAFLKAETGTWNATNYIAQTQIHIANLGTYTVTRASGAGAYIDLTNAAQAINFGADVAATTGIFGWSLSYLGTNSLSLVVTNTGAVAQPTALSLTNGAGVILFVKPQGSQTIKAYQ